MKKLNNIFGYLGGVLTIVLALFFLGFTIGRKTMPTPEVVHDTIEVFDPYWHHMADSIDNYHQNIENALQGQISELQALSSQVDTIYVPTPQDVSDALISSDTLSMLTDYLSIKEFTWEKQDSDLNVILHTVISQNRPVKYTLDYKILKPTSVINQTIDNTITYNKYIQLGVGLPSNILKPYDTATRYIDFANIDLQYVYPRGYFGIEYFPVVGVVGLKAGMTLLKF